MVDGRWLFVGSKEGAIIFWETVKSVGPEIGYIVNNKSKVYDLNSSNKDFWESAGLTFSDQGIEVLGAAIGSVSYVRSTTEAKFAKVGKMIEKLQSISLSNPQEAFCIWNKSVKFKTTYIARTVENSEEYASPYDEAIENFLSCLLGRQLTDSIIQQASLPIRYGGLGLDVKSKDYFTIQFLNSKALTYNIVRNITHGEQISDFKNSELRKNIVKSKKLF